MSNYAAAAELFSYPFGLYDQEEMDAILRVRAEDRVSVPVKYTYQPITVHSFTTLPEYPDDYPIPAEQIMENCYYFAMDTIEDVGRRFVYGDEWGSDGGSLTYNSETDRWTMKIGYYSVHIAVTRTSVLNDSIDIPNDIMHHRVIIHIVAEMDAKDCHIHGEQDVAIYNRVAKFHQQLEREIHLDVSSSPVASSPVASSPVASSPVASTEKAPLLFGNPLGRPRNRPHRIFTKPRPRRHSRSHHSNEDQLGKLLEKLDFKF